MTTNHFAQRLSMTTREEAMAQHPSNLSEQGRALASQREDLIAQGVDPSLLEVPLHPSDTDSTIPYYGD